MWLFFSFLLMFLLLSPPRLVLCYFAMDEFTGEIFMDKDIKVEMVRESARSQINPLVRVPSF